MAFGLPKVGNLLYPGYAFCGKLHVSHISFPPSLYRREDLEIETNTPVPLPPRDPQAHKGSVGDCLFVAGAAGYFGAPYLSAMSFLKAGGGYSRLAAPASLIGCLASKGPEIVYIPQQETAQGSLALENRDALLALSAKVDMAVVGPGLSLHAETQQLVRETGARYSGAPSRRRRRYHGHFRRTGYHPSTASPHRPDPSSRRNVTTHGEIGYRNPFSQHFHSPGNIQTSSIHHCPKGSPFPYWISRWAYHGQSERQLGYGTAGAGMC